MKDKYLNYKGWIKAHDFYKHSKPKPNIDDSAKIALDDAERSRKFRNKIYQTMDDRERNNARNYARLIPDVAGWKDYVEPEPREKKLSPVEKTTTGAKLNQKSRDSFNRMGNIAYNATEARRRSTPEYKESADKELAAKLAKQPQTKYTKEQLAWEDEEGRQEKQENINNFSNAVLFDYQNRHRDDESNMKRARQMGAKSSNLQPEGEYYRQKKLLDENGDPRSIDNISLIPFYKSAAYNNAVLAYNEEYHGEDVDGLKHANPELNTGLSSSKSKALNSGAVKEVDYEALLDAEGLGVTEEGAPKKIVNSDESDDNNVTKLTQQEKLEHDYNLENMPGSDFEQEELQREAWKYAVGELGTKHYGKSIKDATHPVETLTVRDVTGKPTVDAGASVVYKKNPNYKKGDPIPYGIKDQWHAENVIDHEKTEKLRLKNERINAALMQPSKQYDANNMQPAVDAQLNILGRKLIADEAKHERKAALAGSNAEGKTKIHAGKKKYESDEEYRARIAAGHKQIAKNEGGKTSRKVNTTADEDKPKVRRSGRPTKASKAAAGGKTDRLNQYHESEKDYSIRD